MKNGLLEDGCDPMGQAIRDYYETGRAGRLRVFSPQFDEDEMPVGTLFREEEDMPPLELKALDLCRGRDVTAVDISPLSVDVMRRRGVRQAWEADVFDEAFAGCYDTVLMLMNGSGIIGRLERMPLFFRRMKQLLAPGGCVLVDSSDLRYIYEDEDGALDIDLNAGYYGELDFRMQYKRVKGAPFPWLYVDFDTLAYYAQENGFRAERLQDGEHYDYLARLSVTL